MDYARIKSLCELGNIDEIKKYMPVITHTQDEIDSYLMCALLNDHFRIVEYLLQFDPDITDIIDELNVTRDAGYVNDEYVVYLALRTKKCLNDGLISAARIYDFNSFKTFIDWGANNYTEALEWLYSDDPDVTIGRVKCLNYIIKYITDYEFIIKNNIMDLIDPENINIDILIKTLDRNKKLKINIDAYYDLTTLFRNGLPMTYLQRIKFNYLRNCDKDYECILSNIKDEVDYILTPFIIPTIINIINEFLTI
jgi:hypothetical protein